MGTPLINRATVLAVAIWLSAVGGAWADPVVYFNLSNISGEAIISQNGVRVFADSYGSGQSLPPTGTWAINDAVAISELGASSASSGAFDISISPNLFSGSGQSSSSAASADASAAIGAEAWSQTFFGVLFRVTEPTAYDYSARFVGDGQMEGVLWQVDPETGLPSAAALFYDSLGGLGGIDRTLTHSGVLMPGSYAFHALAGTRAFSTSQETAAFDSVTFALATAAPVPEPATLLLVAGGLAVAANRARRRERCRTA